MKGPPLPNSLKIPLSSPGKTTDGQPQAPTPTVQSIYSDLSPHPASPSDNQNPDTDLPKNFSTDEDSRQNPPPTQNPDPNHPYPFSPSCPHPLSPPKPNLQAEIFYTCMAYNEDSDEDLNLSPEDRLRQKQLIDEALNSAKQDYEPLIAYLPEDRED